MSHKTPIRSIVCGGLASIAVPGALMLSEASIDFEDQPDCSEGLYGIYFVKEFFMGCRKN